MEEQPGLQGGLSESFGIGKNKERPVTMDANERRLIEAQCARLINQFSWALDTGEQDDAIAIFTPDCIYGQVDRPPFEGHEGLRTLFGYFAGSDRKMVHTITNILVDVIDSDTAEAKAFGTVYYHEGSFDRETAAPLAPATIVQFDPKFRRTEDGWKVSEWRTQLDFRNA